jgi:hypothetical protein
LPVKNNSVSPNTYDVLTGQGYVDVKNALLNERLSQRSLHKIGSGSIQGLGSVTKLGINIDITDDNKQSVKDLNLYKSPSKNLNGSKLTLFNESNFQSPSMMRSRKDIGASELGGLISSPSGNMCKTNYNIKAGSFTKASRKNQ